MCVCVHVSTLPRFVIVCCFFPKCFPARLLELFKCTRSKAGDAPWVLETNYAQPLIVVM